MIEKTLTELSTKTREVVDAANRAGVVRILRKIRSPQFGGARTVEEVACFVVGVDEYRKMREALHVADIADGMKNRGLE